MTEEESLILEGIYVDADRAIEGFRLATSAACPPGCGICCTRFTPDILPVEAEYLANWMFAHAPERLVSLSVFPAESSGAHRSSDPCPLYLADTPFHCSVYGGRPLICRLFGFSSMLTKNGIPELTDCRHMPMPPGLSRNSRFPLEDSKAPPVAERYGRKVLDIRPEDAVRREILPAALSAAASKLALKRRLADCS